MDQPCQDADYFVQLNELYVKFKQVTKKVNHSTDCEEHKVVEEAGDQENVDQSEWVEASQKLTDSMLGCLDAKLEGMASTEPHYYRLLGMKSSLLLERSKLLASMDEVEESFQVLDEALALLVGLPPRPETSYVTLRLINHFSYVLSVDEHFARAKRVLLEGERVYSQIDEDTIHAGFLAIEELFAPECATPVPRPETSDFLERLATNNVQLLGFVYGRLGDWTRYVGCGHLVLRRQLECREGDALAWAARATRLAQNFLARSRYREARTHLAAASQVIADYEADLRALEPDEEVTAKIAEVELRAGDLGRAWTKYGLHLMDASSKEADDSSSSSSSSSESSSSSASDDGEKSGVKVRPKQDPQNVQVQEQGDVAVDKEGDGNDKISVVQEQGDVVVDKEGDGNDKISVVQEQGDVVVDKEGDGNDKISVVQEQGDVAVDKEGDGNDKISVVQEQGDVAVDKEGDVPDKVSVILEQGDVVVEAVKVNDGVVELAGDEEGEGDHKAKFEKMEEAKEDEAADSRAEIAEITVVEAPSVVEENDDYKENMHCCCLHDGDGDAGDAEDDDDEEVDDADDYVFPTLDLSHILDAVPCQPIDTEDKAHALTQFVMRWSERAMRAYHVTAYPEMYAAAAMDHAEMMRYLAGYAPLDAAYLLHRTRSELLEQVCDSVSEANPHVFVTVSCDLYRELADVQLEMMTLNLRRLDAITEAFHKGTVQEQTE